MDVLSGFGSVPKRGAEVGGLLLGRLIPGAVGVTVEIEDYSLIPIEYRRGPSYLLGENDVGAFDEALGAAHARDHPKPLGFFRSHTREGPGLTAEDAEFCGRRFPDPWSVFLLIKPQVLRVSTAGFVLKRDGSFPEGAPEFEFPFRRRELDPSSTETKPRRRQDREQDAALPEPAAPPVEERVAWTTRITPISDEIPVSRRSAFYWLRSVWWVTLLLLLGGVLGYLGRVSTEDFPVPFVSQWLGQRRPAPYRLGLSVDSSGSSLTLRWDPRAPAVQASTRGSLTIDDGPLHRTIDLDSSELRAGSLVYPRVSNSVRFALEVFPAGGVSVTGTMEWNQ